MNYLGLVRGAPLWSIWQDVWNRWARYPHLGSNPKIPLWGDLEGLTIYSLYPCVSSRKYMDDSPDRRGQSIVCNTSERW